jgi:hypothetical protein
MAGAIVCYSRARERRGAIWLPAALGALAAWLHPWQGEAMILILAVTEGTMWARAGRVPPVRRYVVLLAATVLATLAPLLYYLLLAKLDPQWDLARLAGKHVFSLGALLVALAPLIVASAPAYGKSPSSFIATATRVWPLVVLGVFVVSESGIAAAPLHAFAGITIPLCVLSVEGVRSVAGRQVRAHHWLGPLLVAAVTVPTTIDELRSAVPYISPSLKNGNFITADERRAFSYLAADPQPGGVLARAYLGLITPTFTGRHVYLGACQWSEPNCPGRMQLVHRIFETPGISPAQIRAGVLGTRARFVFNSTCTLPGKDLDRALEPIAASVRRYGCAAVYVLRDPRH